MTRVPQPMVQWSEKKQKPSHALYLLGILYFEGRRRNLVGGVRYDELE